jgi:hypothetical protein
VAKLKKTGRMGRPPVADAAKRKKSMHVLTTEAEYAELQDVAADASMSVSSWVRAVAIERARANAAEKARQERRRRREEHGSS